jgi:hypothetical protein
VGELAPPKILTLQILPCRNHLQGLSSHYGETQAPRQTAPPSKLCATLEFRGDCTWTEFSFNPSDGLLALGGVAT